MSFYLLLNNPLFGQTDTIDTNLDLTITTPEHSPKKAALYSAVLPGLGQAYNKKYWKIPIVYTGIGITAYSIWFNNYYFKDLRTAYEIRTDGNPETIDDYIDILPLESQLIQYAQFYKKNLDVSVLILAGVWLLNIVDAVVDAHLYNFDISDDLSLSFQPTANYWYSGVSSADFRPNTYFGLSIKLNRP